MTYLSFSTFDDGGCTTDGGFESRLERNPFLDYAARYWGVHAAPVQNDVCRLVRAFLLQDSLVACVTQVTSTSNIESTVKIIQKELQDYTLRRNSACPFC